jgi:hypothetical protein
MTTKESGSESHKLRKLKRAGKEEKECKGAGFVVGEE